MPLLAEPAAHWTAPPGTDNPPRCILRFLGKKRSKWRLLSGPRRRFRAQPAPGRDLYLFLFRSLDDSFFITHMIK